MTRVKKLLILLGVLVLLLVSVLLITKLSASNEDVEETYENVFSLDASAVTDLTWTYEGEMVSVSKTDDGWVCDNDEAMPVDADIVESMLTAISDISAYKTILSPTNISQYGLEDAECIINITAGAEYELRFGNVSELDGELYISTGDGNVYLTDSTLLDSFACTKYAIVQKETVPDMSNFQRLSIPQKGLEIYYLENSGYSYSDDYTWFALEDGEYVALDTDNTESFVNYYKYLEWGSCVCYTADSEILAEYCFDNPIAVATVDYLDSEENEAQFTVEVSCVGELYYGHIPDSKMVYLLSDGAGESTLNVSTTSLLPDELISLDMGTVDSIDVYLDGEKYSVKKSYDDEQEMNIYTCGDTELDFENFMYELSYLTVNSYADNADAGEEELKLVFHCSTDNFSTLTMVFSRYSSSECLVVMDGSPDRIVDRSTVVSLVSELGGMLK